MVAAPTRVMPVFSASRGGRGAADGSSPVGGTGTPAGHSWGGREAWGFSERSSRSSYTCTEEGCPAGPRQGRKGVSEQVEGLKGQGTGYTEGQERMFSPDPRGREGAGGRGRKDHESWRWVRRGGQGGRNSKPGR